MMIPSSTQRWVMKIIRSRMCVVDSLVDMQLELHDRSNHQVSVLWKYGHNITEVIEIALDDQTDKQIYYWCETVSIHNIWIHHNSAAVYTSHLFECKCKDNGTYHWVFWIASVRQTRRERGNITWLSCCRLYKNVK